MVRLMPTPGYLQNLFLHFPRETWHRYIHEIAHFVWLLPIAETCIPACFWQVPDEALIVEETSTILNPRKHGRYNPIRSTPSETEHMQFLPGQTSKGGKAYCAYPAAIVDRPQ